MTQAVVAELIPPDQDDREPKIRLAGLKVLGVFGTVMAVLTMFAAFAFGLTMFFGTSLLAAAIVALAWPLIFTPQFTLWVFGAERAPFWKLFLLFLAAGTVLRLIRRQVWQRK